MKDELCLLLLLERLYSNIESTPFFILVWAHQILVSGRPNTHAQTCIYTHREKVDQLSLLAVCRPVLPFFSTTFSLFGNIFFDDKPFSSPRQKNREIIKGKCAFGGIWCWFPSTTNKASDLCRVFRLFAETGLSNSGMTSVKLPLLTVYIYF